MIHAQAVSAQEFIMRAVTMNEFILQGEGIKAAICPAIPGDRLNTGAQPSMGNMFLNDGNLLMRSQYLLHASPVERLDGMA